MPKILNAIGYAASAGLSFGVTVEASVRGAWRLKPRPMPHQHAALLEHSLRLRYRNPRDVLGLYGLEAGMTVLDAGCGTGLFTREMARRVGADGVVHAVDLQPSCIELTKRKLTDAGLLDRVQLHHCGLYKLPLPDESVDIATLIATLGEIPDPLLALTELKRVMKPGARIAVSEEMPDIAYLPERSVKRLMREAGFVYGGRSGAAFCYSAIFTKEDVV